MIDVVVLIVCYNGGNDVIECLHSLANHLPPETINLRTVLLDNASRDGSVARVRVLFPSVEVIEAPENLGFAGGNTLGWEHVQRCHPSARYLMLLNQDTVVGPRWIDPLVDFLDANAGAGAVQPMIMLHPETRLINTAGNRCHYLGFTYVTRYREELRSDEADTEIDAISGAACLLRCDALREVGLFDPSMFMYCEDVDLSWKLRISGRSLHLVPRSLIYHRYVFKGPGSSYFYLQRNRLWMLLIHYRWRTLALLLPALAIAEGGQVVYAASRGLLGAWSKSWWDTLRPGRWRHLHGRRRASRQLRRIADREFLAGAASRIDFGPVAGPLMRWVANPLWAAWWWVARPLLRW